MCLFLNVKRSNLKYPNVGFKSRRLSFYPSVWLKERFLASLTPFQCPHRHLYALCKSY